MTVSVRPITMTDVAGFNAALGAVALEGRFLRLRAAPPLEGTESFVAANLAKGNPQWVAVDGERIVGWCDVCRSDDNGSVHVGSLGMGIIASHRGRGIGRRLIEATLAAARPLFRRIELQVYASNPVAMRLYEAVGFEHEGVRRAAIEINGEDVDIIMMAIIQPLG